MRGVAIATVSYIAAVILGYIPARIAERKGYDLNAWWLFGTLAFLIALPVTLLLTPRQAGPNR